MEDGERLLQPHEMGGDTVTCVELVEWKPSRKHSYNREPTRRVIGITNFDRCNKVYWGIGEVDNKKNISLETIIGKLKPLMVFETRKGYHVYLPIFHSNPLKVFHRLMRMPYLDRGHLRLARARSQEELRYKLVLRVSPKYREPDIYPVYVRERLPEWHREILLLVIYYSRGLGYGEEASQAQSR